LVSRNDRVVEFLGAPDELGFCDRRFGGTEEDRRLRTAKAKRMTEIRLRTSKCEIGKTGKSKEQQRTENGEMLPGGQRLK